MEAIGHIKVYHWKYDDGSIGYAVRTIQGKKKEWQTFGYCVRKTELRRMVKSLKAKNSSVKIVKRKCFPIGGLPAMKPCDFPARDANRSQDGLEAMKSLIFSCRNEFSAQQTLLLVSAILAGYCTQACAEYYTVDHVSPKARHAPVISVRYFDHAYPVLEKIVDSLAINTSVLYPEAYAFSSEPLESKYSPILPKRTKDCSVTDSAYLKLPGLPHQIMPQYRDTTLLIHGRFFPSSEAAKLQRLNPWVSLVLYDVPARKFLSSPVHVDGAVLAWSNCCWDKAVLRFAVERYAGYISRKAGKQKWGKRITKYFLSFEQMILRCNGNANAPSISRAQKFQVSCQMLALRLFLDACVADNGIDEGNASKLLADWYNILLPDCCPGEVLAGLPPAPQEEPEPFQAQFETAVCGILQEDDFQHICFVPEGNICPLNAPDGGLEYWGYVKWYTPKRKDRPEFLSLQFRRNTFETLFPTYCPNYRGKSLFKDIEQLDAEYRDATKARMYEDGTSKQSSIDAIVLNISRADFFTQEITEAIMKLAGLETGTGLERPRKPHN